MLCNSHLNVNENDPVLKIPKCVISNVRNLRMPCGTCMCQWYKGLKMEREIGGRLSDVVTFRDVILIRSDPEDDQYLLLSAIQCVM